MASTTEETLARGVEALLHDAASRLGLADGERDWLIAADRELHVKVPVAGDFGEQRVYDGYRVPALERPRRVGEDGVDGAGKVEALAGPAGTQASAAMARLAPAALAGELVAQPGGWAGTAGTGRPSGRWKTSRSGSPVTV